MVIEEIILAEGQKKVIIAGIKHRVIHGEVPRIEISNNGEKGFISYKKNVIYYCFSAPHVYRGLIGN